MYDNICFIIIIDDMFRVFKFTIDNQLVSGEDYLEGMIWWSNKDILTGRYERSYRSKLHKGHTGQSYIKVIQVKAT